MTIQSAPGALLSGIDELSNKDVMIYPNPAQDEINVKSEILTGKITVMDISGKIILRQKITGSENAITISSLSNGIYYLRLESGENCITKNFVVMH